MELTRPTEPTDQFQPPIPFFKVDPVMVLVFSFLTCGLYLIYWNIKAAEVLNAVAENGQKVCITTFLGP